MTLTTLRCSVYETISEENENRSKGDRQGGIVSIFRDSRGARSLFQAERILKR